MATGSRTLTLKLLADIDNFQKNLKSADNNVGGFQSGLEKFSKAAGAAFLAAGAAAAAYAGKLAIDGVKAAIADEAAQLKLAKSLENVTGATEQQIKATEDYILKTSLAFGVTDEQLRPSLDRLVRSTKDVAEAQKLQTLALNIAAGTGKDLTAVSEALARAHDGNFASLKKLGVSIDESIIKEKNFDAATTLLATTFRDQATAQADTFDGKLRRLQISFDEGKETIGAFILTAIQPLVDILVTKVIPAIADFTSNIGEKLQPVIKFITPILDGMKAAFDKVRGSLEENNDKLQPFYNLIKNIAEFIVKYLAPAVGTTLGAAFRILGNILDTIITQFANVVSFLTSVYNKVKAIIDFLKNNPITNFFSGASFGGGGGGGFTPAVYRPPSTGGYNLPSDIPTFISPNEAARERGAFQGNQTNITINGAIDPESTARQLVSLLNDSFYRGTGGADGLVYA